MQGGECTSTHRLTDNWRVPQGTAGIRLPDALASLVIHTPSIPSSSSAMAAAFRRAIACELAPEKAAMAKRASRPPSVAANPAPRIQPADPSPEGARIVLQPRVTNLRSYGAGASREAAVVISSPRREVPGGGYFSPFYASLADYIESSRRSQDFETLSGRLAMLVFAAAMTVEVVTGSSVFHKLELGEMEEAAGACLGVVACAAGLAWASSMRTRIGRMFTLGCSNVVDALIDSLVDGLFYDSDPTDWTDDI
ncbi:hypothetical protein Taro_049612 [Colocasia esculenta]|uniref:Stress enhanced protein 2 n=1 Tax=Colocasia esculenta TaxID=4460 RepID=A0A843XBH3_COLES|nr:hypothetical protein [Colocasia esculenta]